MATFIKFKRLNGLPHGPENKFFITQTGVDLSDPRLAGAVAEELLAAGKSFWAKKQLPPSLCDNIGIYKLDITKHLSFCMQLIIYLYFYETFQDF